MYNVLFELDYSEFEILIYGKMGDSLRLDNNQLHTLYQLVMDGEWGDQISDIYELTKEYQDSVA